MRAEIIAVGTELTSGQKLDTNSAWLSRRLLELGVMPCWHTTLPDDLEIIVTALDLSRQRADLVVITGGLGPTLDDLTREALARLAGVELVLHEPSLRHIEDIFARRGRPMPERNRLQAMLPRGAEALPNPLGTAPGIWMTVPRTPCACPREEHPLNLGLAKPRTTLIALPGVPSELRTMWQTIVAPRLQQQLHSPLVFRERVLHCFGLGESAIEAKLGDLTKRGRNPEVGITASDATISLRLVAQAPTDAEAQALLDADEAFIRQQLGEVVFGSGDDELQHAVARLLERTQLTLATAESVTGGLVASRLTQVPGISRFFRGGIVAYQTTSKASVLGIPAHLLEQYGAVSAPVAEAMAQRVRQLFQADLAISTTGVAGPDPDERGQPVGLVYVGLAWTNGVRCCEVRWFGERLEIQSRAAKTALNELRLHLLRMLPATR
ncbi:MAG: competence/damage-inducible protein A [Gemmatales bacterium]|nr:competence/damage-inducible protein A [Gemmatales bacterium]MCS7160710.1 competence/damage-inducible protein A [Gemmatales bacterium]MDW8175911.1 competence/damage-inducible protein A [Gemmatales bacterium]MDW8221428.1 competence/damage-inducible protein A [Gemmatales bacterium]